MPRGRRPLPTAVKLVRGNRGKRPLNRREPKPLKVIPRCPPELAPAARKEWRRISRHLFDLGLLTAIDRAALAIYCQGWAQWLDAQAQLDKYGSVVKAPTGYPIMSPYLAIANQAQAQMRASLIEFGMTPASRSKVEVTIPRDPADPAARFLTG